MAGPQMLPSLTSAFHLCERLLIGMSRNNPAAVERLRQTEERLIRFWMC